MTRESRPAERYVGLISGTSMDGIDAVVVDFSGAKPHTEAAITQPFDASTRALLDRLRADPEQLPLSDFCQLDAHLGESLAQATLQVLAEADLAPADIRAIGSHGQTVLHHPESERPYTLQAGDPHRLAALTGITTVSDFRRADLAAGGQGAPLAPLLHDVLFRSELESRAVINLGGIANVTLLEPGRDLRGFDTGPANCFLDLWYRRHHSDRFDANGDWAASGHVDERWIDVLCADPYFIRTGPRSTGIEYFSESWLNARLPDWAMQRPADIQATLAEFSARTIARALLADSTARPDRLLICGGGVHNRDLVARLGEALSPARVESSDEHGIDPDHVESALFAWLARARLNEQRIDTGPVTGARHALLLGSVTRP